MLLLIFFGTGLGTVWLGMDGGHWVVRALGGALLVYALSGLFLPAFKIKPEAERWLGPVCGLVTGVITSATGVFVIPAVPYLQALGLDRDQLVQALGSHSACRRWRWPPGWLGVALWVVAKSMRRCWLCCLRCWACGSARCCAGASVRCCSSGYFLSVWRCWVVTC